MVTRSPHEARPLSWTPCCVSCRRPAGWAVGTGGWVMRWSGLERLARRGSVTASVGVAAIHPELGSHLEASITLGVRCTYQPVEPVVWRL